MAWIVLLTIIALPVAEIAFFVKVAGLIGILPAILAAILAGMGGLALLRRQGLQTAARAQRSFEKGELPVEQVFDGVCLLVAGALLLLPGFLGDIVALALLLPPVRMVLRRWLGRHLVPRPPREPGPPVIEVEFREVPSDDRDR